MLKQVAYFLLNECKQKINLTAKVKNCHIKLYYVQDRYRGEDIFFRFLKL